MADRTYFEQRNYDNTLKLRQLLKELPYICNDYFMGIENRTSILTRLGYAQDLKIFFHFLTTECAEFVNIKDIRQFGYEQLESVETFHIEMFLNYLTAFEHDGVEYTNTEKTKARKLATIKSFFKYNYNKDRIPADPALADLAYKAAVDVVGEDSAFIGNIATGDQFVASESYVEVLQDSFDSLACEMEGAAVGLVAYQYGVPFVVIRCMSDKADGLAHETYDGFGDQAADNSASIVMEMLGNMQ